MGAITRSVANNITTGGIILPAGINDASVASITELAQVSAGDGITLISSQTASASSSISFTSGIDSTYRTYLFKFINIHQQTDNVDFTFNLSTDGGSNYNVTKTSTFFRAYHDEADTLTGVDYETGRDLAQSTAYQTITQQVGNDNDQATSGYMYLFNPSSTTYVKHFLACTNVANYANYSFNLFTAGYGNTTSAINAIDFKIASGNIDAGTIHMYGIAWYGTDHTNIIGISRKQEVSIKETYEHRKNKVFYIWESENHFMSIALSLGNNLTTGGVFKASAVNNTSCNNITDFAGIAGGGTLVLLSTQTASASSSISFTSGIDSTYDEYVFKFINIHPATDSVYFRFNGSTDGGSNYNVIKTSTYFTAAHDEPDTTAVLNYLTGNDLAQSTSYQDISYGVGNGADESTSGYLHLFQPSSTTYVKHFIGNVNFYYEGDYTLNSYVSGYFNTTSAINAIDFKFSSGNIDDGIIKMYGVAKA